MADSSPHPTYRTIARAAGVSAVTVSLAMRNSSRIPKATKDRIREIAAAQGYKPDPNVSKLMSHLRTRRRTNISSNLMAFRLLEGEHVIFSAGVLAGAREEADRLGYALEVMNLDDSRQLSAARLEKILRSRGVEGLILLPMTPIDLTDLLNWSPFSVVATSHSILRPTFNTVVPNQFANMMRLCERLAVDNHDAHAGIITGITHDLRVNHRFTSAYLWHMTIGGWPLIPPLLVDPESLDGAVLLQWIEEHDLKLIITELGLMKSIRMHLPGPMIDRIKWVYTGLDPNERGLCGIYENPPEIGRAAVDLLAGMIQRGERGVPEAPRSMEIMGSIKLGK